MQIKTLKRPNQKHVFNTSTFNKTVKITFWKFGLYHIFININTTASENIHEKTSWILGKRHTAAIFQWQNTKTLIEPSPPFKIELFARIAIGFSSYLSSQKTCLSTVWLGFWRHLRNDNASTTKKLGPIFFISFFKRLNNLFGMAKLCEKDCLVLAWGWKG